MTRSSSPASRTRSSASSRCSREIVVVVTRQPRVAAACSGEAAPAGADLQHVVGRAAGRACRRCGRAWPATPPRASCRGARRSRPSTSSSRRASARTGRCRGRSGRRCPRARAAACCARAAPRPRCQGSRTGVMRAAELVDAVQVARGDLDHRGHVGRVPQPVDVGLGHALAAARAARSRRAGRGRRRSPAASRSRRRGASRPRRGSAGRTRCAPAERDDEAAGDTCRSSRGLRAGVGVVRHALELQGDAVGVDQGERAQRGAARARRRLNGRRRRFRVASKATPAVARGSRCAPRASRRAPVARTVVVVVHAHEGRDVQRLVERARRCRAEDVGVALAPRRVRDLGDDARAARRRVEAVVEATPG